MFDETFDKVLRTINTIQHPGQAETASNLIEQFRKLRKDEALANTLRGYLYKKVEGFPAIIEGEAKTEKKDITVPIGQTAVELAGAVISAVA
jgi:hypothetical protein